MATTAEIRQWLKAQGEQVNEKGALPERLKAKWAAAHGEQPGPRRLPDPDELDDEPPEEFGPIIEPAESPQDQAPAGPGPGSSHTPGPGPDEPPKHAAREWRQPRARARQGKTAAPKITVGLRADIDAKVRFALTVPGTIWQARDPLCGGTFVQQIPDTAEAFTDIICDSPDLIAFFTGPGGAFMKYLKLGAALMPVAQVVMAHHVYHSIEIGEGEGEAAPDYAQYAAL